MTSNLGMAIPWNIALEESKNGNLTFLGDNEEEKNYSSGSSENFRE